MLQQLFASLRAILTGHAGTPPNPETSQVESGRVEEGGDPPSSSPGRRDQGPSPERIADHAYHRWISRGKPLGSDWEDWFAAERHLGPTA